ncbi:hypothetical protein [Acinetobacter rudis]|uniref:Uncharacterized protein n=1 Tax=Acinetobacter rudis CIP 110305 TaxID=421052 RepID=S3NIY6_9GAMM|nr:hypothetical protein [Acinetobacter rudis]EPF74269.1 hypothetical protein F945_01636 [Acinetobacter rudis CIP 110305]
MFVTTQLNAIAEILGVERFSNSIYSILQQQYVNIEATLLRSKVLRNFSKANTHTIIQTAIPRDHASLAYLFAPFVLANLNQKVIYSTPATAAVLDVFNPYYQAEAKQFRQDFEALDALNLVIDLMPDDLSDVDFLHLALVKALCRSDISSIFLLSPLEIDQQKCAELEKFFQIKIKVLSTASLDNLQIDAPLNFRKLLFKNKDTCYSELCQQFARLNAELLHGCVDYRDQQLQHLIDDMFYTEHIYEKLSVYGEFMQTRLQNHLQSKQQSVQLKA